jgi:hypothetical protein
MAKLQAGVGFKLKVALAGLAVVAVVGGAYAFSNGAILSHLMEGVHHTLHAHAEHDEGNMPGLQGKNATPEESAELALMFRKFETLSRTVTNLSDGIRTVTKSSDEQAMDALVSHVVGMVGRVEVGDDPEIFIQSPTLDIFFARGDRIVSQIEVTEEGIVVVQTSQDPEVVLALQVHVAEVSDLSARRMQAVHEAMMARLAD